MLLYCTLSRRSVLSDLKIGVLGLMVAGCTSGWLPAAGPTVSQINREAQRASSEEKLTESSVQLLDVDMALLRSLGGGGGGDGFPDKWRIGKPSLVLGNGDMVQISIFEAPPAVLLSSMVSASSAMDLSIGGGAGVLNLPDQMVSQDGTITVPFAGQIQVAGHTSTQVEQVIRGRLRSVANQPQVVVRLTQNQTNGVLVISDGRSLRIPLTSKGERLLDVVPLAGDAKKVKNTSIRLTRNGVSKWISLNTLSQQPRQNVYLSNGDVVTVTQEAYRVTVLGATNSNAVVDFGAEGLSVTEAIGRMAGLNDYRADARGVYVFRRASNTGAGYAYDNPQIIYHLDMSSTQGMMLAQSFKLQDKDMIYVSNAPSVQLQKVLNLFNSTLTPVVNTANAVNAVN